MEEILSKYGMQSKEQQEWLNFLPNLPVDLQQELLYIYITQDQKVIGQYLDKISYAIAERHKVDNRFIDKDNNPVKDSLWQSPGFDHEQNIIMVSMYNLFYKPKQEKGKRCPSCKSDDTSVFMVQLRSADEPASVITFCNACNYRNRKD